jgi:hypothetical protein
MSNAITIINSLRARSPLWRKMATITIECVPTSGCEAQGCDSEHTTTYNISYCKRKETLPLVDPPADMACTPHTPVHNYGADTYLSQLI